MTKKTNTNTNTNINININTEKKETLAAPQAFTADMDVNAALEKFSEVLAKTDALNAQCNDQLKAVAGALIGAAFAFSKKPARFNNFMKKAAALIGKSAVSKYRKNLMDYIAHECGVDIEEGSYAVSDTAALQAGADALKTASLTTYQSEETQKAAADAKAERAEKKQAFVDATAHQRVMLKLTTMCDDARARRAALDKITDMKKRNEKEIKKTTEEITTIEALIAFMDQRTK